MNYLHVIFKKYRYIWDHVFLKHRLMGPLATQKHENYHFDYFYNRENYEHYLWTEFDLREVDVLIFLFSSHPKVPKLARKMRNS
jgi:hypothetical protein